MEIDEPRDLDQPWARTLPARAVREFVVCGVFGSIMNTYSRRQIVGLEHLEQLEGPVIFVANHCSHVDTPALLRSLPGRWRRRTLVAAAADYFYTKRPLASAVSLAFGTVPLERRGGGIGLDAAERIKVLVDSGWSLILFPEGTRSRDGRVGRLRSGAAVLAAEQGLPIVPIHISGTREAMPTGRHWMVRPQGVGRWARHTIPVSLGAPIHVDAREDRLEVMERVRLFMESCGAETTIDPKLTAKRAAAVADPSRPVRGAAAQRV